MHDEISEEIMEIKPKCYTRQELFHPKEYLVIHFSFSETKYFLDYVLNKHFNWKFCNENAHNLMYNVIFRTWMQRRIVPAVEIVMTPQN